MAKSAKTARAESFPPTTLRVDPDLKYRAERLALENKRAGRPEASIGRVMNAALAAYLKGKA